jgi:hypothetical protein
LNEVVADPDNLDSLVGGWSAFVRFQFLERFKLIGEKEVFSTVNTEIILII